MGGSYHHWRCSLMAPSGCRLQYHWTLVAPIHCTVTVGLALTAGHRLSRMCLLPSPSAAGKASTALATQGLAHRLKSYTLASGARIARHASGRALLGHAGVDERHSQWFGHVPVRAA